MSRGALRNCPECRRPWPSGAEHDLRSFRWLDDLPRHVSPTNIDCLIHDGDFGRRRFLVLETKRPDEPVQKGQARALIALAGLDAEHLGVRILSGTMGSLGIHRVTRDGIEERGTPTSPARVREAVVRWLNGSTWRDAEAGLRVPASEPVAASPAVACFTCGSLPIGTFNDGSPRFGCGPHIPNVAA